MSKWTAEDIDVRDEVVRRAYEHECFLAFNDDELAELFHDWWNNEGIKDFLDWANTFRSVK